MSDSDILGPEVVSQEQLGKVSRQVDYSDDVRIFYSSGGGKQIGFTPSDLEVLADGFEQTFREAGLKPSDTAVNWGAPEDKEHMSQWCYENGTDYIKEVVNSSVADDFSEYRDRWDDITAFLSMPRMVKSIGKQLEKEYGDLEELFPESRISLTAGDVMSESLREWIEESYGIKAVNFYAGTEPGAVAAEIEPGVYRPANSHLDLEILEEGTEVGPDGRVDEESVYDLSDLENGEKVTGPILISAEHREALPFRRYRLGDVWTVRGSENGPIMRFEGREDNVILYSGANLYPEEIDRAVRAIEDQDWKMVVSEEDDYVWLNFYLPDSRMDEKELSDSIAEENKTVEAWKDAGEGAMNVRAEKFNSKKNLADLLEERHSFDSETGELPLLDDIGPDPESFKRSRIAFDSSYTPETTP